MNIIKNKTTRALILIMGAFVIIAIVIAKNYYSKKNASIDPRIVEARELYEKYNQFAETSQLDSVFHLLNQIEAVYAGIPHYKKSFEVGVLYNNRAATYLTLALYSPVLSTDTIAVDSLMARAEKYVQTSIHLYTNWLSEYEELSEAAIQLLITDTFKIGLSHFTQEEQEQFLTHRISEIQDAQIETPRRLSVSYTNLGIIFRYRENLEEAAECYIKALELWDQNLTAENNLNKLLGKPLKKRTILQKLFPPERK